MRGWRGTFSPPARQLPWRYGTGRLIRIAAFYTFRPVRVGAFCTDDAVVVNNK